MKWLLADDRTELTEDEANRVIEAVERGLKQERKTKCTSGDIDSVRNWICGVRLCTTVLEMVLEGLLDIMPSPDGDAKKVTFALATVSDAMGSESTATDGLSGSHNITDTRT